MSVLILMVYGKPGAMAEAQNQYFMRLAITPWLLLLTAPAVIAVLYYVASPETRARMRPHLGPAGLSALWYFGAFTLLPLLAMVGGATMQLWDKTSASWILMFPLIMCVGYLPMLWVLFFVLFSTGPAIRSAFNTANVHATLPALLTGVLVWEFAAIGPVMGGLPPGPSLIQFGALICGPLSVTAVAWWEIHRLRSLHGVRLRH
ncbi:hypothetical protein ACFV3E_41995 [Streptomyces sp. NPDC059718]